MTSQCALTIKNKHHRWMKYKYCKSDINFQQYKAARNKVSSELRKAKYLYEKDIALKIKDNNKLFWSYVCSKSKIKMSVSKLDRGNGELTKNDQETSDVLNDYFANVFRVEDDQDLPTFLEQPFAQMLEHTEITNVSMSKATKKVNPSKSQGPEMIHPKLTKESQAALVEPLTNIFRKSLEEGKIPKIWKKSQCNGNIQKMEKDQKQINTMYRPISLTSVPGKTMERIIRDALVEHMNNNKLFSEEQHGFIKGKSCVTQLLEFMEDITKAIDQGDEFDIIYLDFSKAFDKVPHRRLLMKLKSYGIRGKVLCWIKDFLINRKQRVIVNGSFSEWKDITSGIPQGSVLGPILFLIFINDLPKVTKCLIKLSADDAKLYQIIKSNQDKEDLQGDVRKKDKITLENVLTGSAVITHDVTTGTGYGLVGFNWIIDFLNLLIRHSVT